MKLVIAAFTSFMMLMSGGFIATAVKAQPDPLSACTYSNYYRDIPCSEVDRALTESASIFRLDERRFRRVAKCESGLNPYNDSKRNYGLFQHSKKHWAGRVRVYNSGYEYKVPGNPNNPFDNSRIAAWMIHNGGWGPWASCL